MPKTIFARASRSQAHPEEENDPLQERALEPEDDELTEQERGEIGDLGNEEDNASIDALINQIEARAPSRMSLLMHRVAESLLALRGLQGRNTNGWPKERVPQEHWCFLADEALGLLGVEARRELDEQRLIQSMPESQRGSFQRLCDSRRGLAIFHKSFDRERAAWEKSYWKRALNESFGKCAWTGPSGGRVEDRLGA